MSSPDIRERIYWSTSALAYLDNRSRQTSPMTAFTSSIESQGESSDSRVKALNNFCILLSRGIKKESHYSILAGPTLAQSLSIVVVVSCDHALGQPSAQLQNYDEHIRINKRIISPTEYASIDDILKVDPAKVDFHHYIQMAIRALKWGAENQSLQDQVSIFFLSHCFPKIKRRFTSLDRAYFHGNSLAEWKYQEDDGSLADTKIHIGHSGLQQLLLKLGIPQDHENCFEFTGELSTKWFQAILRLCEAYRAGFDDTTPNVASVLRASTLTSLLLRKIPKAFWKIKSLNLILGKLRYRALENWRTENKRNILDIPTYIREDGQTNGTLDDQNNPLCPEDEDETEEWETLLLNSELVDKLGKHSVPYQSRLFVASLESVNSWTRAVASICRNRYLCRARIDVDLKVIELPGLPLCGPTPPEIEALLKRWARWLTVGQLSSFQTILESIRASKPPTLGCHSEAAIIAVFLCKEESKLDALPPRAREAFQDIIELNRVYNYCEPDYIPIGVSTPICATCRVFERSLFWSARISFGCASRTGKCVSWMSPSWIPKQNLIELESTLLDKLMDKLPHTSW